GIDKTNIGFVATSTFVKDAHLHRNDIPNSLSLFSATYVPLQPISVLIGRKIGPHWWLPIILLTWGGICMAHAAVNSTRSLIALRLLLGAAESGFTQTAFYYMSLLYPKFSLGLRMGLFSGMYSVAGAFAGLLAYGLLHIQTKHIHGWQLVFLFEGGLTVLVGIAALLILPRDVESAWFLNAAERAHAKRRMDRDLADAQEMETYDADGNPITGPKRNNISLRDVTDVLKDWKKLCIIVCNIFAVLPVTVFTTFLPLVVQGMGYKGIRANLMSVPPFVVGATGLVIFVASSDYFQERSIHTVVGMLLGMIGCIVMAVSKDPKLRYGFAHVCMSGIFASGPLVAVWLAGNTPWKSSRSFILGLNGYSNLAGVIAGQLFKAQYAPSYHYPLMVTMILIAVGALGFLTLRGLYMLENRKRRNIIASWDAQRFAEEETSAERRGDQRYTWIYSY
ncbi:hypothetical protein BAUCODRAFT_62198, partial [Baudoinia panamericana UAMH 10762]